MADERWPPLGYDDWKDTYDTLHMWTQVVGKIALATAPPLNHCWGSALRLTARGLSTPVLAHDDRSFAIEFDFIDHRLTIQVSDGSRRELPLAAESVADFYGETMEALRVLSLPVTIWTMPVEVEAPIRFTDDTVHRSYDPRLANRFWRILLGVERVLTRARARFIGKASPVNFFWGSFDLALTRFSGRVGPPPKAEWPKFMCDAYSHEVISHGFWPGSGPVREPAFYAYAVPEPAGLREVPIRPDAAYYHGELGEFILPYEAVRTAVSPEQAILEFVDSTYVQAATLAKWDRATLERDVVTS